jgi:hypothetical protein
MLFSAKQQQRRSKFGHVSAGGFSQIWVIDGPTVDGGAGGSSE